MAILRSLILPFLAIVALCLWIVMGVWFGLSRTALKDDFVLDFLEEHGFYHLVEDAIRETAIDAVKANLSAGDARMLEDTVSAVLSEEWIRGEVERNLAGVLAFLRGKAETFRFLLDLGEPKSRLRTELSRGRSQPVVDRISPYLADIPETLDLDSYWGMGDMSWMEEYSRYRAYLPYLAVVLALAVLISFALAGLSGGMQWTGSTALIPGILLILGFTIGTSIGVQAIERAFISYGTAVEGFGLEAAADGLRAVSAPIRNFGIAIACLGGLLMGGSYFLKSFQSQEAASS